MSLTEEEIFIKFLSRAIGSTKLLVKIIAELNTFVADLYKTYHTSRKKQDIVLLQTFKKEIGNIARHGIGSFFSMVVVSSDNLCEYPPVGGPLTPHVLRILFELFNPQFPSDKEAKENKEKITIDRNLLEIIYRLKKCFDETVSQLLAIHAKKFKKEKDQLTMKISTILGDVDKILLLQNESTTSVDIIEKTIKTNKIQEQLFELNQVGKSGRKVEEFYLTLINLHIPEVSSCIIL